MRDFPDLYVCQHSAVLPYVSLISLSIGSFGVGNVSRGFFVCSERKCSIFVSVLLSGDAHARRPLHKIDGVFFFFPFCRSVVGTSGLAPSATSGPLILQVLRKI